MVCADTMSVVFIESQKSLWVLKGNPDICHPRSYCQYYVNFYDHDDAFYLFVVEMCILAKNNISRGKEQDSPAGFRNFSWIEIISNKHVFELNVGRSPLKYL